MGCLNLYVPIGPAGCGKSTLYEEIKDSYYIHERISPDQIRMDILGKDFDESSEPMIWRLVWEQLQCLRIERNASAIYFDATNLTFARRYELISRCRALWETVNTIFILFDTPLEQCLHQNRLRSRRVPDDVIAKQYLALQKPESWENGMIVNPKIFRG